jgi:hypothetical protein
MIKVLFTIMMSLFFQACQVDENVSGSKQKASVNFPGATFTTVLSENGWKKLGDNIDIYLTFPLPVSVAGWPYIDVKIGTNTRRFYFDSGSDSTTLLFRYTVTPLDLDSDGIEFGQIINLNGGSLTYSPGLDLIQNTPYALSIPENLIQVDGVPPTLATITKPIGGNYSTGQELIYFLNFSEEVNVVGNPFFSINNLTNTASSPVVANYKSGTGTSQLEYSHPIIPSDADTDGFDIDLFLDFSAALIYDQAGNQFSGVLPPASSADVLINVTQPVITSITPSPASGTFTAGQVLSFTVAFSQAVNVTGTPSLQVMLNTGTYLATYTSGSGTSNLVFSYTVQPNHVDANGIALVSPIMLNGGTIQNTAGNQNAALLYTPPTTSSIFVDAAIGPYVLSSFYPNNGFYTEGQYLDFTLNFNRVVQINGNPRLPIIVGSTTYYANYQSGHNTNALTFRYNILAGHEDLDGVSLSGPINLPVGSYIRDTASKDAILSYTTPNTTGIKVDGTTPTITNVVATTAAGNLVQNKRANFSVTYSEPIDFDSTLGSPTLSIVVGTTPRSATYLSGKGTTTLNFGYIIQAGETDTNGIDVVSPIVSNGTVIKDPRNHVASSSFSSFTTALTVDAVGPSIIAITPPINGSYKIGDHLDFEIDWDEDIYLSGNPRLALMVGLTPVYATFHSVTSTSSLKFRYTVQAGHLDTNGIDYSIASIDLNGGTIKDVYGNNASLNFSSLVPILNLPSVLVDGVIPFATFSVGGYPANGIYKAGQSLSFTLTWSENVTLVGIPELHLVIGATSIVFIKTSSTATTMTFSKDIDSGQLDEDGIAMLPAIFLSTGVTIKDTAGNSAYLVITPPVLTGVKVDAILPTIAAFVPPVNDTYKTGDHLDFKVMWSEPVTINTSLGLPRIPIVIGSANLYAEYQPAMSDSLNSYFRYTVVLNDYDNNGIVVSSPIVLNSATIRDAATNDAVLSYTVPTLTNVLVDGITPRIDPANPVTPHPNGSYKIGDTIDFKINWTEPITIDDTLGYPKIYICLKSSLGLCNFKLATYEPTTSTSTATVFRYTVVTGDSAPSGISVYSPIYLNGATIQDVDAGNNADLYFTASPQTFPLIKVDGVPPYIASASSSNKTVAASPNYFKPGHIIQYDIVFDDVVHIDGPSPSLIIDIGGLSRTATYYSGDNSTTLSFRFQMDANDVLLDLDGITVNPTLNLAGGNIRDVAGNAFGNPGMPFFYEKDYVYFASFTGRYHVADSDYVTTTCGVDQCLTQIRDISGSNNHFNKTGTGQLKVLSGFGTNSTKSLQFINNTTGLFHGNAIRIKYALFVMKTMPSVSVSTSSIHKLMRKRYTNSSFTQFIDSFKFQSTSTNKVIAMGPSAKLKINAGNFSPAYTTSESAPTLWIPDSNYIMAFEVSDPTPSGWSPSWTYLGDVGFNGQIAEVIFLSDQPTTPAMTEAQINRIRDQLNGIHGVY